MKSTSVLKDETVQEEDAGNVLTGLQSVGFLFVFVFAYEVYDA